tara:strand:+ start:354 stop:716 length:363 start_codon:yes stop_codon:yes gene_type:complete
MTFNKKFWCEISTVAPAANPNSKKRTGVLSDISIITTDDTFVKKLPYFFQNLDHFTRIKNVNVICADPTVIVWVDSFVQFVVFPLDPNMLPPIGPDFLGYGCAKPNAAATPNLIDGTINI